MLLLALFYFIRREKMWHEDAIFQALKEYAMKEMPCENGWRLQEGTIHFLATAASEAYCKRMNDKVTDKGERK
jgi:hypothetical protein